MRKKVAIARKLISKEEIKRGTGIFVSKAWSERADAIQDRVHRRNEKNRAKSAIRKEAKKKAKLLKSK
jgi:hypothetical protein